MEERLKPVNAILGLVTPGDVNAPVLLEAGYRLIGLEVPIVGPTGRVVADVVLFCEESLHLVLIEAKSGANVDVSQAERYRSLEPTAAVQATGVSVPRRGAITVDVVYACLADNLDRIKLGLANAELSCPIIAVSETEICLEGAEASPLLASAWTDGAIPLAGPPVRVLAFDHETPPENLAPFVHAQLVSELSNRVQEITIRSLTERVAPHFPWFSNSAQGRLVSNVRTAVRTIIEDDPETFAYVPATATRSDDLVSMLRTPEDRDHRGRTQAYQALRGRGIRRKGPAVSDHQIDLLDLLAEESASETDLPTEGEEAKEGQG